MKFINLAKVSFHKGPLTVSMQICLFFNRSLQLPRAAKVEIFGIDM